MANELEETVPVMPPDSYSEDGVDLTLIRWMLSLTPMERLDVLQNFIDEINEIRDATANKKNP